MRFGRDALTAIAAIAGVAAVGALLAFNYFRTGGRPSAEVDVGRTLYQEYCARCHGVNLEGQADWKRPLASGRLPAPPHDTSGHTWHHPERVLFEITKYGPAAVVSGGYESDMPGFQEVLSDDEIRAVLSFIRSTWPERERRYQRNISDRDAARNR